MKKILIINITFKIFCYNYQHKATIPYIETNTFYCHFLRQNVCIVILVFRSIIYSYKSNNFNFQSFFMLCSLLSLVAFEQYCISCFVFALRILFRRILNVLFPLSLRHSFTVLFPLFSFRFSFSIYIFSPSVLLEGNYDALTQNQIEEMCEASLMFSRATKTGASRRLSRV